jgi:predicted transcriptional regulator
MVAMTVRMREAIAERLRLLAFKTRRGKGDLVVDALTRFLDGAGV